MESIDDLRSAIQRLVQLATGIDSVILANQGKPAPKGLHATYALTPIRAYGHSRIRRMDASPAQDFDPALGEWHDFTETSITTIEFMVSVNILNEGADTAAMRLHNANFRSPVRDHLFANGLAWRYVSAIRDLTGKLQAGIQPRFQADIHLFAETRISYPVLRAAGFAIDIRDERDQPLYGA